MPLFTPEELHRKILYFELKMILKDPARLGMTLPHCWKQDLWKLRDEELVFRMLADWFSEQDGQFAAELSELILLQIELMEEIPVDYLSMKTETYGKNPDLAPWQIDALELPSEKTKRRAEILEALYGFGGLVRVLECRISKREFYVKSPGDSLESFVAERLQQEGISTDGKFWSSFNNNTLEQVYHQEVKAQPGRTNRAITDMYRFARLNMRFNSPPDWDTTPQIILVHRGKPAGLANGFVNRMLFRCTTEEGCDFSVEQGYGYGFRLENSRMEDLARLKDHINPRAVTFLDHSVMSEAPPAGMLEPLPAPEVIPVDEPELPPAQWETSLAFSKLSEEDIEKITAFVNVAYAHDTGRIRDSPP
jgi:hypothetical protein